MDSRIKKNPTQIFECYVEYIRPQDDKVPEIKRLFPKNHQFDEDLKKNLAKFVFPTKDANTNAEEHFTFCLTDLQGTFRFGFCRYPPRGDLCSCFISDLPWFKVFYKILDKLYDFHSDHQTELMDPFLTSLYKHPVPSLNNDTVMTIIPEGIDTGQVYTLPLPNSRRLPEIPTDHNLTLFYPTLHHQVILCLYANMLFERRIIITSSSLKTLSAAVHGCVLLLYPLFWQHIFIPITPHHLIDYCTAPMPFLMGIHSSMMDQVRAMPINDAVILDVDQSELESPYYEDLLNIPPDVSSQLKNTLKKSSSAYGDTCTKAFLQANVALLGGYRLALKMREGDSTVTFDRESFIKSRPHMEEFLTLLLEFQHFQQFLNGRIERLKCNRERDIFDDEVIVYEEELKSGKWSSDQMKVAFKDMKDLLQKHSTKVAKNTRTLMKDTKNLLQGKGNERISDLYSSWSPNISNKSATLPATSTSSQDSRQKPKVPPPVIPYEQHKVGMDKLNQMLDLQKKRISISDGPPLIITTSDTSQRFNLDYNSAESASIGSKDSLEVATGQLVDLSDSAHSIERMPTPVLIRPGLSDEGDTDSASIVSSSSTSSGSMWGGVDTITKNEHVSESPPTMPPVPPPRKKHREKGKGGDGGNEMFELSNRSSPLSDFGSSIADALIKSSRRISDPVTAGSVSTAAEELHKALQDTTFTTSSSQTILTGSATPISSTAPPTFNTTTSDMRMPAISEDVKPPNDPWQPIHAPSNEDHNPFKPGGALMSSTDPPVAKGSTPVARALPPLKPQPYSGSGLRNFEKMMTTPSGNETLMPLNVSKLDASVGGASAANKSGDPLGDIFGHDGLKGYAMK